VQDIVIIFKHFFFDKLFSYLIGGLLSKKPHPYRLSLCVTAALLGSAYGTGTSAKEV